MSKSKVDTLIQLEASFEDNGLGTLHNPDDVLTFHLAEQKLTHDQFESAFVVVDNCRQDLIDVVGDNKLANLSWQLTRADCSVQLNIGLDASPDTGVHLSLHTSGSVTLQDKLLELEQRYSDYLPDDE